MAEQPSLPRDVPLPGIAISERHNYDSQIINKSLSAPLTVRR
jgi:hypothetical protein